MRTLRILTLALGISLAIGGAAFAYGPYGGGGWGGPMGGPGYHMAGGGWGGHMMQPGYHMYAANGQTGPAYGPASCPGWSAPQAMPHWGYGPAYPAPGAPNTAPDNNFGSGYDR